MASVFGMQFPSLSICLPVFLRGDRPAGRNASRNGCCHPLKWTESATTKSFATASCGRPSYEQGFGDVTKPLVGLPATNKRAHNNVPEPHKQGSHTLYAPCAVRPEVERWPYSLGPILALAANRRRNLTNHGWRDTPGRAGRSLSHGHDCDYKRLQWRSRRLTCLTRRLCVQGSDRRHASSVSAETFSPAGTTTRTPEAFPRKRSAGRSGTTDDRLPRA